MNNIKYGAFIITYERPTIVVDAIHKLLAQTLPPETILIVDNSSTPSTENAIRALNNQQIEYYRTGYNSGAAGGAYFGLQMLSQRDLNWILWVDDDDAPDDKTMIQRLVNKLTSYSDISSVGMIGTVGSDFNFRRGELRRYSNEELSSKPYLEGKVIAGGMLPLINAEVIKKGALPNKDFFFAFEDLDFCLKVDRLNYKIIIPTEIMMEMRRMKGRWDFTPTYFNKKSDVKILWREYYSVRNMTYIFRYEFRKPTIVMWYFIKFLIKILLSFRKGFRYGWQTTTYTALGFYHGCIGKLGLTIKPIAKYQS